MPEVRRPSIVAVSASRLVGASKVRVVSGDSGEQLVGGGFGLFIGSATNSRCCRPSGSRASSSSSSAVGSLVWLGFVDFAYILQNSI